MKYIVLIAVIGIVLLQLTGSIPLSSVGGPMVIACAYFAAALAVAIYDAWTKKLGVLGWFVNIVVTFVSVFLSSQLGGFVMAMMLYPFMDGASSVMAVALAGTMVITLLGSWGALWVVNKWRSRRSGIQAHPEQT